MSGLARQAVIQESGGRKGDGGGSMKRRYSVIVPAYNAEAYISETLLSVLQQVDAMFEVIVVNDGSTDRTLEKISELGENIKIVDQENLGISAARNAGAAVAEGEFLAFVDADDVWMPEKLKIQDAKMAKGYKWSYTNRYNFGDIGDVPELQSDVVSMKEGDIWLSLLHGNFITTSSVVVDRSLFNELGGFRDDMRYCEDWELWIRCAEKNFIGYCADPCVKYRIHSGGLSKNYKAMSAMRNRVITGALSSSRASEMPIECRRQVLSSSWSTSGWDAARAKDYREALRCYLVAVTKWPKNGPVWYDLARLVAGRI